jgi:tRNA nucleotidyltransferase (CCA-adding enzyme)
MDDAPIIHDFLCYNNRVNLADLLKKSLDPAQLDLIGQVADEASAWGSPLHLVGGSVRDLLLGRPINDLDLTVEGNAIALGRALVKKRGGRLKAFYKFGTASWIFPSSVSNIGFLDLISARKESYDRPGALPTVEMSSLDDDLRRRDFTINAMAIRLDGGHFGRLYDPLHGREDLENHVIRVLHPDSFLDDPTRIFRAARGEGRNGFKMDPDTLRLVNPESLSVLQKVSGRRILRELDLNFEEEKYDVVIGRLGALKVLDALKLPPFNNTYKDLIDELPDPGWGMPYDRATLGWILWLSDTDPSVISPLATRLRFTAGLTNILISASMLKHQLPGMQMSKPSGWTFALEEDPLLSVYGVYLMTRQKELMDYLNTWRHIKPVTTGDDLKKRGLEPGPRYSEILRRLRLAWLDGEVKTAEGEIDLLVALLKEET